ncbi:MAG: ABC transporter substrate-binding protein [Pirellulaceae bacterium]
MTSCSRKRVRGAFVAALAAGLALTVLVAGQAQARYGAEGEPVRLTVGYQPYYAQAWSGAVMREKEFWREYLPEGSRVDFQIGLQGSLIVNAMLAGRQHIGYMGDMPALVSTTKERVGDIRLVANLGLAHDQCNIFLVDPDRDAPADPVEALEWLDGKQVASPHGSCTDRFARAVFEQLEIEPSAYMNQNIEVIGSNLRAGRLDAAVIWEPMATKLEEEGTGRRFASGVNLDERDGAFLAMRADLIEARPDVVKGWLQAELDAQLFMADPANFREVAEILERQTSGFEPETLWQALYGANEVGGAPVRQEFHFAFTPEAMELIEAATTFLYETDAIENSELRENAIVREFADEVLRERGLTAPIGEIEAQSDSPFGE